MMKRKTRHLFVFVGLCLVGMVSVVTQGVGLRSIGLRIELSWSDTPVWVGVEASTNLPQSVLIGSLFVTPGGKTLFTGNLDIPLQAEGTAFLRLTGGFYYFDSRQWAPSPLAGIGLSYLPLAQSPVYMGFAGEFIYPLAFPLPMFSISGGWLPQ